MIRLRRTAALLLWATALVAASRYVFEPLRCNRVEARVIRSTEKLNRENPPPEFTAPRARQNLESIAPCVYCSVDASRYMVAAANLRFLNRNAEAASMYQTALLYDQRPELYLNLGLTLIDLQRDSEALPLLIKACTFNPELEAQISLHHDEVREAVDSLYLRLVREEKEKRTQ